MPSCRQCHQSFTVSESDLAFYETVSPVFAGERFSVPPPTLCPQCRLQRRLMWRNERTLYSRPCDLCHQPTIATYPPESKYTVYCEACWWSEQWSAVAYQQDYDFGRSFFEQYDELLQRVPQVSLTNARTTLENSDYVNFTTNAKNCYLCLATDYIENCYYCSYIWECKECIDCFHCTKAELCYECSDCDNLYHCFYVQQSKGCRDCVLSYGLINCNNCFGCVNLTNKEYYIFNQPVSPTEYERVVRESLADPQRWQHMTKRFKEFTLQFPRRATYQIHCEECTGSAIKDCHHCQSCFDGYGGENLKWVHNFPGQVKDCYDISGCAQLELGLECVAAGLPGYKVLFSNVVFNGVSDVLYSSFCVNSSNLFGCVGLRQAKYCILNKSYAPAEYEKIVAKIIVQMQQTGEWGEFFPGQISPYAYNESVVHELFPLTPAEVNQRGWRWRTESTQPQATQSAHTCTKCQRPFKIIPQEQTFYHTHGLLPPTICPECRHRWRVAQRPPIQLWERVCARCGQTMSTNYAPERPEIIYCGRCYTTAVY